MLARIQIRRDTYQNWFDNNPILFAGEIGFETTRNGIPSNKFKIGDGVSNWNNLEYQLGQWSVDTVNQELYYNDLDVAIDKNLSIGESLEVAKNLVIHGDFLIKGKTTTINNKNVTFNDSVLTLNWSEDPITPYQTELLSGIEINTGLDEVSTLMEGNLLITSVSYDSSTDETTVELSEQLQTPWPYPYYQNKVLYYSDTTDPSLNKIFSIKSYNNQNRQIKLIGDASSSLNNSDYVHIHNTKKQIVWGNTPFFEGWYIDDNLHVNGVITSDSTATWVVIPDSTDIFYDLGNVAIGNLTPSEKLEVDGAVKIGTTTTDTSLLSGGEIKYDSNDFFGYDGTEWKSLTSGGGSISYSDLTDKPTIPSDLTDLGITDGSNGQFLKTDGNGSFSFSNFVESDTLDNVLERSNSTTRDIKTSGKIYFSNVFATEAELFAVSASTYHGMFAHVHDTGSAYFSHSGSWIKLANFNDISSGGGAAYTNSDVDTHLNKDVNSDGKVLSWDQNSNSYTWVDQSGGNASVSIGDIEPTEKNNGDLWWNSNSGVLRIYYTDEDNDSYWIDIPSSTTGGTSSSGSTLSNISDTAFGVDVTGKVQADGIDLGSNGLTASAGSTLDFSGTTINFNSTTITGDTVFNGIINNHIWAGPTEPTNGHVLSWNSTLLNGDGDYEWVAQSSGTNYSNSDVDAHLNQTNPTAGHVLSWSGTDYAWVAQSSGGSSYITDNNSEVDVSTNLNVDGVIKINGAEEKFTTNSNSVGGTDTTYNYIHIMVSNNYTLLVGDHLYVINSDTIKKYLGKVISFETVTYNYIDYYKVKLGAPDEGVVTGTSVYVDNIETYNFANEELSSSIYRNTLEWFIVYGNSYDWNTLSLPDNTPAAYQEVISVTPTTLDCSSSYVHKIDGNILSNFSINITNLNLEDSHVCVVTVFVQQGADAYIPNTLELSGTSTPITWPNNTEPTPTPNGMDIFSFTILRSGVSYTVLGQGMSFGG